MMRVQVTGYHIFVIYLGLGLVVCLKGKNFPSSVNVYFPHSFYFESYKVYSGHTHIGHNSASKYWLLTPLENSHVGHTHTRPQLRKQMLIIDSSWEFPCCSFIYIRKIIQIMFCIIFFFFNSEKMLKCYHQFYYKKITVKCLQINVTINVTNVPFTK